MSVREKGFSLVELVVTLLVLSIVLGIGVPSFNSFIDSSRLRAATHGLNTAVQLARSEAISRRQTAAACRSNVGQTACSFGVDWSSGWMVVLLDGADLEAAADVEVVRVWDEVNVVASGAVNGFVFERSGVAESVASLDINNDSGNRCLDINLSGRVLVQENSCP